MENFIDVVKNSLIKNQNLSQYSRDTVLEIVKEYTYRFKEYNIELDFQNIASLLETLNIAVFSSEGKYIPYDNNSNIIYIKNDPSIDDEAFKETFGKSVLSLITNIYNPSTGKYNEGLNFEINGKRYGHMINEKIKDRIHELTFGNNDSMIVTVPTIADELSANFQEMVGSDNLLTYFVNGRGDLLYSDIVKLCDSEKESLDFFENLNSYENSDPNDIVELNKCAEIYRKQRIKIINNKTMQKQLA